jgi:plastocyanin
VINATILAGSSAAGNPDYDPDELTVNQGDGVQWTNEDNVPHTVTSKADPPAFDSSLINAGATWLLNTIELSPAEYEYYCFVHPHMTATLTVAGEGAAPAEDAGNETAPAPADQSEAGNQSSTGNETSGSPANGGATVTAVSIAVGASVPTNGEFYDPESVETTVGSMVTWTNDDTLPHTVTSGVVENNSPQPDGKYDSGIMNAGDTFSFVFDSAGESPYYCLIHPWMTGQVTVN